MREGRVLLLWAWVSAAVLCGHASLAFSGTEAGTARDISDRAYLPAVLAAMDRAEKSIEVSMYSVGITSASEKDPAWSLVSALMRAAKSGKRVRLWLNTRQASVGSARIFLREDIQRSLQASGVEVFYLDPTRRLHDKLADTGRRPAGKG